MTHQTESEIRKKYRLYFFRHLIMFIRFILQLSVFWLIIHLINYLLLVGLNSFIFRNFIFLHFYSIFPVQNVHIFDFFVHSVVIYLYVVLDFIQHPSIVFFTESEQEILVFGRYGLLSVYSLH